MLQFQSYKFFSEGLLFWRALYIADTQIFVFVFVQHFLIIISE